jgi:hypothetical protein
LKPLPLVTRQGFLTFWIWAVVLCALFVVHPVARAAEGIEIVQAHLEPGDDGYRLSATYAFDLTHGLEEALARGIPLYFTTEVEISRPRWYWFDEKTIRASQTARISYNVLTRQYRASTIGSLQQNFSSLDDALTLIKRPSRWEVAPRNALKPGETYNVAIHVELDVTQLPKPFQVNALNNADWRLSSDWKLFNFRVEGR